MTHPSSAHSPAVRSSAGRRLRWRALVAGSAFAALALALLVLSLYVPRAALAQDGGEADADIIVQFNDNARAVRSVTFTPPISGLAALVLSGLDVVTTATNFGPAVCSIEGVGCPAENCFCAGNSYWGYSWWDGAAWQPYSVGASASVITQTGAIEGWRWGEWGDAQVAATQSTAALSGLDWLAALTETTRSADASASATVEMMFAAGANLEDAASWPGVPGLPSLEEDLALSGAAYSRISAGAAGKQATAVVATDACLPAAALSPSAWYSPTLGAYSNKGAGDNAWAMLGVLALGEEPPTAAITSLKALALLSGAWEWAPGWEADTNSTALALQVLVAAGEPITASSVVSGVAWLKSTQNDDGGFPYSPGPQGSSDANSTAYVVQALVAAGEDVEGAGWTRNGNTPIDFLLARQQSNGAFEWQAGTGADVLATQQAVVALLRRPFPIAVGAPQSCPATLLPIGRASATSDVESK